MDIVHALDEQDLDAAVIYSLNKVLYTREQVYGHNNSELDDAIRMVLDYYRPDYTLEN